MRITVLVDNAEYSPGWEAVWGFSALVENDAGEKIIFDAGPDPDKLLANLARSGEDIGDIGAAVFSHSHWDHTDGVEGFLRENRDARVFVPGIFPSSFAEAVRSSGHPSAPAGLVVMNVIKDIWLTPYFTGIGGPDEAGIVIDRGDSLDLLTGCAHPGILQMVRNVKGLFARDVRAVIGGFHLKNYGDAAVEILIECLKEEGVSVFAPCHCTGERQINIFDCKCGAGFIKMGCGRKVLLEKEGAVK